MTSGGDCAGLNAAIRAVVYRATGTYDRERQEQGKNYCLVIVSEAVRTETGESVLIAAAFGVAAVDLIAEQKYDRMVTWQNR